MAPTIKCPSSLALHRLYFMCVAQVKLQTEGGRAGEDSEIERERESQKVAKIVKNKGETEEQPLSVGQNCFSVPWGRLPSSANYKKFNYKLL